MGTADREAAEREVTLTRGNEYRWWPDPMDVLKWSAVVFVCCLEILVVIAIVLAMFGVF
jgi:hypothetical protein